MPIPDWQLTPEEEVFGDAELDANGSQSLVDENGMPLALPPSEMGPPQQQPPPNQFPQQRPPAPGSAPPADPSQPGA